MILRHSNRPIFTKIFFYFYILLNLIQLISAISASIKSDIVGEGFHRILKYYVDIGDFQDNSCHIAVFLQLPVSLYVNTDELADFRRLSKSSSCSEGEVDVELFAEKAHNQSISICSRLTSSKKILTIPIHQRYHMPSRTGGTIKVVLMQPKLLIGCRDRLKEHRVSQTRICSPCLEYAKKWRDIPYQWKGDDYFVWEIPIGNTSQKFTVKCITLFVTILGAAYILHTIYKSYNNLEDKKNKDN